MVITKVLVNRIRPLLRDLVYPTQVSFIHGRQAADNIIIALKLMNTIRRSNSKNGLMAVKIDLEKAYDRVSWQFLRDTRRDFAFYEKWKRLIMLCVENSNLGSFMERGKARLFYFKPQRGLREGLAEPYLFVLRMELT